MKKIIKPLAMIIILLSVLCFLLLCKPPAPEKVEKVKIGLLPDSISALLYIAQQQGMFNRHGLDVEFENYQAGAYAMNDLLADKIDIATAIEFVLVLQGFKREDLRAIGTISSSDSLEMVAKRDRGIEKPEDLKGKIVGSSKGTATDFFLSAFLSFNNIHPREVRTADVKPADVLAALSEGTIDAAVSFSPYLGAIKKKLSGKILSWPAQGGRDFYYLLIAREDLVKSRPRVITGLLKAVLEAETFLKKHEREAEGIVMSILGVDQEALRLPLKMSFLRKHESISSRHNWTPACAGVTNWELLEVPLRSTWSKTRFRVRLDQDLLTLMEDEGRWAIRNKLVDAEKIPDYSTFLHLEGLRKIKPEAVGAN